MTAIAEQIAGKLAIAHCNKVLSAMDFRELHAYALHLMTDRYTGPDGIDLEGLMNDIKDDNDGSEEEIVKFLKSQGLDDSQVLELLDLL